MFARITERRGEAIEASLEKRLVKGEPKLIELAASYLDGRPVQRVQVETPQPLTLNIHLPDGTTKTL